MNRVKWILLGVCLFGMLIGAAVAYSGYVKKRLDADGAETRAVLTASFRGPNASDTGPDTGDGCTAISVKSAPSIISDTGSGWAGPIIPARSAKRKIS